MDINGFVYPEISVSMGCVSGNGFPTKNTASDVLEELMQLI